ncbi:MAG: M24 family metallopeptidase [Candidatus Bathyarchaeia archaeon]
MEDLDGLMGKYGLEAIVVHGESTFHNPELYFVTRTHLARGGIYLKKVDESPILIVNGVDLGSARRGVVNKVHTYVEKGFNKIIHSHEGEGLPIVFSKLLREEGVSGRIGFYGTVEANLNIFIVDKLRKMGYDVNSTRSQVLKEAMATKSEKEIKDLTFVGRLCEGAIEHVFSLLQQCTLTMGKVMFQGKAVTIGSLKSELNHYFAEKGLVPDEGYILSAGVKSSDPHYTGEARDFVKSGRPILLDIYPRGPGNLYFDVTRTFVMGRASKRVKDMYYAVVEAHEASMDVLREGVGAAEAMNVACEVLERRGYRTLRSHRNPKNGFTHSLGHGVGWSLNDKPTLSLFSRDTLKAGNVVTVEPGLYDKKVGGVRLEDVVAVHKKGILKLSRLEVPFEV